MPLDTVAKSKPALFLLCLMPLGWLIWDIYNNGLGADPVAQLEHRSGDWALRFLLITLTVTPLRRLTKLNKLIRYRRMFGLFAFFYASLHLTVYLAVDLQGYWSQIFTEIVKRPYITMGFSAWLLLIPLAVTSTKALMKRLGRNWHPLHRLIYLIAILGVLHYWWLVKADVREPLLYGAVLLVLLTLRIKKFTLKAHQQQ